jgi:tetratricopeptide (TPR) repeat protein
VRLCSAAAIGERAIAELPARRQTLDPAGIAFTGLGDNRRALQAYDKALGISPDYLPALEGAAELEYKAGSTRAISHLNRILQQRPNDPSSHAMLAALAYKQHHYATAAKHFAQSAQLTATQPAALAEDGA